MAYMQHDGFGASGGSPTAGTYREVASVFTALERQVIALAARDRLSSLATARRPIAQALFGVQPARALADPRLEALRRFVVLCRHGHRGAESSRQALIATGFSRKLLDDLCGTIPVNRPAAVPALIGLAAIVTLFAAVVALVARSVDAWLPATAIALAVCLPLVVSVHTLWAPAQHPRRAS